LGTGGIESDIVTNQRSLGGNYDGSAAKTKGFAEAGLSGPVRPTTVPFARIKPAADHSIRSPLARIAAGNEVGDQALGRAIDQWRTIGRPDVSARGQHKGVPRRNVPIMRRRQARIEVSGSLGDPAKFDR
jgi:hypothetical protein